MATDLVIHGGTGEEPPRLVAFRLGEKVFGLPIAKVREVVAPGPMMPLPQVPAKVRGAVNLAGRFAVVIDLRTALGLPASGASEAEVGLAVEHEGHAYVLLVDTVDEMDDMGPSDLAIETLDIAAIIGG